jgi:outer membrane murein-binding lipoprotein Lpp
VVTKSGNELVVSGAKVSDQLLATQTTSGAKTEKLSDLVSTLPTKLDTLNTIDKIASNIIKRDISRTIAPESSAPDNRTGNLPSLSKLQGIINKKSATPASPNNTSSSIVNNYYPSQSGSVSSQLRASGF